MLETHAYDWDVFISHAYEDKESVVRGLASSLEAEGLRVWYDEFTLTVGDSLGHSIDHGLKRSRYGIVVLSPSFFAKRWPQIELDGLQTRERDGTKVILPVWHGLDFDGVASYSPTLAGRLAASTSGGMGEVVRQVLRAIRDSRTNPTFQSRSAGQQEDLLAQIKTAIAALPDMKRMYRPPSIPNKILKTVTVRFNLFYPNLPLCVWDCRARGLFSIFSVRFLVLGTTGLHFEDDNTEGVIPYSSFRDCEFSMTSNNESFGSMGWGVRYALTFGKALFVYSDMGPISYAPDPTFIVTVLNSIKRLCP